jgi:hypothetical protein
VGTNVFANYCANAKRSSDSGFDFADGPKWHRAKYGEAAGADTRTSQKGAAIDSGAVGGETCERAAARLPICSLDQHDCLPHFG